MVEQGAVMIAWFVASHLISRFVGGGLMKLFLGNLMGDLKKLWGWLCHRSFWQLAFMGLAIFAVIQHFELAHARAEAAKWHNQFTTEHSGRLADRKSYVDAQTAAAKLNQKQIAHVKQQQQEITDATVSHLSARLQFIAGELRGQGSATQSASGSAAAGDPGQAPCRAIDPAWLCLSPEARLSAAESEERHDELIDWVIAQSNVDPNAP